MLFGKDEVFTMPDFDEKDKLLLNAMINQPGQNQEQLAKLLDVTKLTIQNRIKRLKKNKILLGMVPVVDLQRMGYNLTVIVLVKIKNGLTKEAVKELSTDPNVTAAYDITGEYDILLIAKAHNMNELDQWNKKLLKKTDLIERVNTSTAFSTPKEGTNPNKIE